MRNIGLYLFFIGILRTKKGEKDMKKISINKYPKILLEEVNGGFEYLYGKEQDKVTNKY
ncbi:hypothetical protein C5S53_08520 [Methanophagales archaeon]|nr:hypothetical protein C5S53_08520 [Methanophagales archaeon]